MASEDRWADLRARVLHYQQELNVPEMDCVDVEELADLLAERDEFERALQSLDTINMTDTEFDNAYPTDTGNADDNEVYGYAMSQRNVSGIARAALRRAKEGA